MNAGEMAQPISENTHCSSRGPEFNSQQPHSGSQPSVMGSDALFWCVWRQQQCTHIHKVDKSFFFQCVAQFILISNTGLKAGEMVQIFAIQPRGLEFKSSELTLKGQCSSAVISAWGRQKQKDPWAWWPFNLQPTQPIRSRDTKCSIIGEDILYWP